MAAKSPRKLHKDLIAYFDGVAKKSQAFNFALNANKPRLAFIALEQSCIGLVEKTPNSSPVIDLFLKTVSEAPGYSWCMAFQQSCIGYIEQRMGVVSLIPKSSNCVNVWENSPPSIRVKNIPLTGAIAVWQHQANKIKGHTGAVLSCDGEVMYCVEGNTGKDNIDMNQPINSNGEGVWYTSRFYDRLRVQPNSDMLLLGCLKPFESGF